MLTLPFPTVPGNGQPLDATPVLANILAIAQAIQSFDGAQVQAGSITAAALNANINPNTLLKETTLPFIQTGLIWSVVSGLNGTMSAGVIYINGIRVPVNSVASNAFAANKDTYIDIDVNGNITYQAVTTNAASPSLAANSVRVGICVAGAAITSFNQGSTLATAPVIASNIIAVSDSLGNVIYPNNPNGGLIGYRAITGSFSTAAAAATAIPGLTCPVIVPGVNRRVRVMMSSGVSAFNSNSGVFAVISAWRGTVGSGSLIDEKQGSTASAGQQFGLLATGHDTTSGAQTYSGALHEIGGGTATANVAPAVAFISVELE